MNPLPLILTFSPLPPSNSTIFPLPSLLSSFPKRDLTDGACRGKGRTEQKGRGGFTENGFLLKTERFLLFSPAKGKLNNIGMKCAPHMYFLLGKSLSQSLSFLTRLFRSLSVLSFRRRRKDHGWSLALRREDWNTSIYNVSQLLRSIFCSFVSIATCVD